MQRRLDRRHAELELGGDLFERMVEHVLQDHAAALRRCQRQEAAERGLHRLLSRERVVGLEPGFAGELGGGVERLAGADALVPPVIDRPVVGDAEQPRPERQASWSSATARSSRGPAFPGPRPRHRRPSRSCACSSGAAPGGRARPGRGTAAAPARARRSGRTAASPPRRPVQPEKKPYDPISVQLDPLRRLDATLLDAGGERLERRQRGQRVRAVGLVVGDDVHEADAVAEAEGRVA